MRVTELELSAATLACLQAAGIADVAQLTVHTGSELVRHSGMPAAALYEIVCQLNKQGLSLPPVPGGMIRVPSDRHLEMFRLRIIEGLPLAEIGKQTGVKQERVRQLLRLYFGLSGTPPAAKARRRPHSNANSSNPMPDV
jgi:hypothetical protein